MSANPPSPSADRARVDCAPCNGTGNDGFGHPCQWCQQAPPVTADRARVEAVRATLEQVAQEYDFAAHWHERSQETAAALREAATWAPPAEERATLPDVMALREMAAAIARADAAYDTSDASYAALCKAKDAWENATTPDALLPLLARLSGAPPEDEGLRAAAERVVACPCLAGASCHALDALADLLAAVSPLPQKEQRDET